MTKLQLRELRDGDLIQSRLTQKLYLVSATIAALIPALVEDVVNPEDWTLVAKARALHSVHREEATIEPHSL